MTIKFIPGVCGYVLADMDADSVQLVVTSPPYNVGWPYGGNPDIDRLPINTYKGKLGNVFIELYRVLKPGGVLCINVPPTIRIPGEHRAWPLAAWVQMNLMSAGWLLREPLVWVKANSNGQPMAHSTAIGAATNSYLRPTHEMVIIASKQDYRIDGMVWDRETVLFDHLKDVWHLPPARPPKKGDPPAFPDELARRLIALYSRPGDTVLDPYAGTGTTGRVAETLGRHSILIEREELYFDRLEQLAA